MAHCVEVTCLDICKESLSELQTVIQYTVDTAIHIIIFMMDLLSGTNSMDASMTTLSSLSILNCTL